MSLSRRFARFNSRSREGATKKYLDDIGEYCFNSRSREGATRSFRTNKLKIHVSIHAPVRERRHRVAFGISDGGFNSRSREGATQSFK